MPQVSKYLLSKDIEEKMFAIFWQSIADLKNPEEVESFFNDLLGRVERTMLAKRLAVALLLTKKYGYEAVSHTLKVSYATIASVAMWLKEGGEGYGLVINRLLKEEKLKEFWERVEDTIAEILPPSSTGRYFRHRRAKRPIKGPLG